MVVVGFAFAARGNAYDLRYRVVLRGDDVARQRRHACAVGEFLRSRPARIYHLGVEVDEDHRERNLAELVF